MSNTYEATGPEGAGLASGDAPGRTETAKHEASDLKDTATARAKDVLGTTKDEASSVLGEAKVQMKDLYATSTQEMKDQANTQQERIAAGLRSIGDELGAMAAQSSGGGVAGDLVGQVSTRLSAAAAWLSDRDADGVLSEVKRFARRKPGTFILGAAITGIVIGRLTRALAANASDAKDDAAAPDYPPAPAADYLPAPAPELAQRDPLTPVPVSGTDDVTAGTPVYAQTVSSQADIPKEDGDDRPRAF